MTSNAVIESIEGRDAERVLIAAALKDEFRLTDHGLSALDFTDDLTRGIAGAIQQIESEGVDIDLARLVDLLKHDEFEAWTVSKLAAYAQNVSTPYNLIPYVTALKNQSARTKLLKLSAMINEAAEGSDLKKLLAKADEKLEEIHKGVASYTTSRRHVSVISEEAGVRYQALYEGKSFNISTGLPCIDAVTRGGGSAGDIWIIGGFTGQGKSALALHMARKQADMGIPVLVISREMLDIENFERLHSACADIPLWQVRTHMREGLLSQLKSTLPEVAKKPIWIDSNSSTVHAIRKEIQDAVKTDGIQVVYVDYLQLLEAGQRMNRTEEIAYCSKMLKRCAMENQILVVALAQYNRLANYAGKAENYQFDGASQIEKDASVVLHLELEQVPDGTPIPKWRTGQIRMGKGRQFAAVPTQIWFRGETFTFTDNEADTWKT